MNDYEEFEQEDQHRRYEQQKISVVGTRKMTAFTMSQSFVSCWMISRVVLGRYSYSTYLGGIRLPLVVLWSIFS